MEKQEFYPIKVWCWAGRYAQEILVYLPYKGLPVGKTCPNCLKTIELDGTHTWNLTKPLS